MLTFDLKALLHDHPEAAWLPDEELVRRYWAYDPFVVAQARFRARWRISVSRPFGRWLVDLLWRLTKGMR